MENLLAARMAEQWTETLGDRRNLHWPRTTFPNAGARFGYGSDRIRREGKRGRRSESLLETAESVAGEDSSRGGRLVSGIHQSGSGEPARRGASP